MYGGWRDGVGGDGGEAVNAMAMWLVLRGGDWCWVDIVAAVAVIGGGGGGGGGGGCGGGCGFGWRGGDGGDAESGECCLLLAIPNTPPNCFHPHYDHVLHDANHEMRWEQSPGVLAYH